VPRAATVHLERDAEFGAHLGDHVGGEEVVGDVGDALAAVRAVVSAISCIENPKMSSSTSAARSCGERRARSVPAASRVDCGEASRGELAAEPLARGGSSRVAVTSTRGSSQRVRRTRSNQRLEAIELHGAGELQGSPFGLPEEPLSAPQQDWVQNQPVACALRDESCPYPDDEQARGKDTGAYDFGLGTRLREP
jgi:hypothetical protein